MGFLGGSVIKNPPANAGDAGSTPGSGRSPGEGNGNPLQYCCLGNPMDREETSGLQSMQSQRVGRDWATKQQKESQRTYTPRERWALDRHCSQDLVIDFQQSDYDLPRQGFFHICFICWPSWFYKLMPFTTFGKFSVTISLNYFFCSILFALFQQP